MGLKIRLARAGAKKRPYYHIVVADSRSPRDGRFIEKLGSYNPMLPAEHADRVRLQDERIQHWLSQGAVSTERVARFLGHAGHRADAEVERAAAPVRAEEEGAGTGEGRGRGLICRTADPDGRGRTAAWRAWAGACAQLHRRPGRSGGLLSAVRRGRPAFALRWTGEGVAEIFTLDGGLRRKVADRTAAAKLTNMRLYVDREQLAASRRRGVLPRRPRRAGGRRRERRGARDGRRGA